MKTVKDIGRAGDVNSLVVFCCIDATIDVLYLINRHSVGVGSVKRIKMKKNTVNAVPGGRIVHQRKFEQMTQEIFRVK